MAGGYAPPISGFLQGKTIPPLDVMLFCGVVSAVAWCPLRVFLVSVSCLFSFLMADGMVSYRVFLSCFSSFALFSFSSFFVVFVRGLRRTSGGRAAVCSTGRGMMRRTRIGAA
ncbi:hypothetical protein [Bifidobacterium longum]|uniref:hypothetical protein n=1 Tax=Bifidobacterium longum TaxID=216816 RepID=UPI002023D574|nr:hypothetical protein [Bifidobacterium longum]